jgi:hypothetical protein
VAQTDINNQAVGKVKEDVDENPAPRIELGPHIIERKGGQQKRTRHGDLRAGAEVLGLVKILQEKLERFRVLLDVHMDFEVFR